MALDDIDVYDLDILLWLLLMHPHILNPMDDV